MHLHSGLAVQAKGAFGAFRWVRFLRSLMIGFVGDHCELRILRCAEDDNEPSALRVTTNAREQQRQKECRVMV